MIKQCIICGSEFNALNSTKACSKECRKYVKLNYQKQQRLINPERYKNYCKIAYAKNPDKHCERSANYRKAHPDKVKDSHRNWKNNNLETSREINRTNMRIRRQLETRITLNQMESNNDI